jgi:membrane-associated phospholipid phosphatase
MMQPASVFRTDHDATNSPATRSRHVAYWVSQIASPPVLGVAVALLAAAALATPAAWLWSVIYLVLAIGVPCLYIVWLVRRGELADVHLPVREQRIRPMLCAVGAALAAWVVLNLAAAPRLLQSIAAVNSVQSVLFVLITLRWKISLHTATSANLTVLGLGLMGSPALPLVALTPLVAWARIQLQRHTLGQTFAGATLGAALVIAALWYVA